MDERCPRQASSSASSTIPAAVSSPRIDEHKREKRASRSGARQARVGLTRLRDWLAADHATDPATVRSSSSARRDATAGRSIEVR
jgi:hypothetical protein